MQLFINVAAQNIVGNMCYEIIGVGAITFEVYYQKGTLVYQFRF